MNRRTFLGRVGAAGASFYAAGALPRAAGMEADGASDLLARARENIVKVRQADASVTVKSRAGQAIAGARVEWEQTRHRFLFGCNFFGFDRCGKPDLEGQYRERFAAMFNFCTLGFYWAAYESERGRPGYAYTDKVVEWARERGIRCKGHPLVWDHPASSPRWLPESDEDLARLSDQRVREIVTRYQGRIDVWDVVNEATHLPDKVNRTRMARWGAALGNVAYTRTPLVSARAANPNATLLVNDYRTAPDYHKLLERLRAEEPRLFDVVGIQSHMHDGPWPLARVWQICDAYRDLKLPIHFTETTLVSGPRTGPGENWGPTNPELEERQARQTVEFYTMLFGHPAVEALTWWDFSDLRAWQGAAAGWLRADMSPKPVYERMLGLIQGEWRTRASGQTSPEGVAKARGFLGDYRVSVVLANGEKVVRETSLEPNRPNQLEVVI